MRAGEFFEYVEADEYKKDQFEACIKACLKFIENVRDDYLFPPHMSLGESGKIWGGFKERMINEIERM